MSTWHVMRPEWLWCLVPVVILVVLLWRQRDRNGSWSAVIEPSLLSHLVADKDTGRGRNYLPWLLAGWTLAVVAASGPSWQKIPQPVLQKQDAIVIVLDLSYSMKSGDLQPSRIDRARQKLLDMLERRNEGQTGLVAFAGDAHIVTPLTDDTRTIANLLPALNPDMMPVPGSSPVAALSEAVSLLESAGINGGRILLVTDAVTENERKQLADIVRRSGVSLSIMGVGTPTGAPIPLPRGGFLKDTKGAIVMPALDESALRAAADASGGRYMTLQIESRDLDYLLAGETLTRAENTLAIDRNADTWEDQGYLFLLLIAPLVLALFRRGWIACTLPLLFVLGPDKASAGLWENLWLTADQQGQRALQQGNPEAAATLFENQDWAGIANYQAGEFENATQAFSEQDGADNWYNRGNALAREGQLQEAIEAYRESLARNEKQQDALENIALLEQLLEQQQQQQQEQQNQDQQQDQNQQQNEQSADSESKPAENGDKQQQAGDNEQQNADQDQATENNAANQQDANGPDQQPPSPEQNQQPQSGSEQQSQDQQSPDEDDSADDESGEPRQAQADATQADPEQQERDQAMEQWLRRVPDDPSGLLREKFRYQSQQRQQQRKGNRDAQAW